MPTRTSSPSSARSLRSDLGGSSILASDTKLDFDGIRVSKVNGEDVQAFYARVLDTKVPMSKEERIDTAPDWNPTPKVYSTQGQLKPQSATFADFKNDPNDPNSMHKLVNGLRGNKFETLFMFNPDGSLLAKATSQKDNQAVAPDLNDQRRFIRSAGLSVHNHPEIDMTFSGPDLYSWLTSNNPEMMVVSPNFAFSMSHGDSTQKAPKGKQDNSSYPKEVQADFEKAYYSERGILETKKLVQRYGWARTNKETGVKTKVYGDEAEPSSGLVLKTHAERCIRAIAQKYGFKYTKYALPKQETI